VNALIFLIVFPLCIAVLAAVLPAAMSTLRRIIGVIATIALCAIPINLLVTYLDKGLDIFILIATCLIT